MNETPMDSTERSVSAYVQHILDAISFVEKYHHTSFDPNSLSKLQLFRQLSPTAQYYTARLSLRKGMWHRSERTMSCLQESEVSVFVDTLITCISMRIVEPLNDSLSSDIIWEAITECLLVDELQTLHQLIAKCRCKGDRHNLLASLHREWRTSRSIFNQHLPLLQLVHRSYAAGVLTSFMNLPRLLRLQPAFLQAIRQAQRLYQLTASSTTIISGRDVISVHTPPPLNASLLALFRKVKYPKYHISQSSSLFPTASALQLWEAAMELRYSYNEMSSFITKFEQTQHTTTFSIDDLAVLLPDRQKFEQILRITNASLLLLKQSCGRRAIHLLGKIIEAVRSGKESGDAGVALCAAVVLRELIRTHEATDMRPPFLSQLHPGCILAVLLWDSINTFERQCRNGSTSNKTSYTLPIAMLRLILSSPWSPHRRGRWYERLIINLTHEGKLIEACRVAATAVEDVHVRGGSRLNLKKRHQQLEKRVGDTSSVFNHTPDILTIIRDRYVENEKVEFCNWSCSACTYINIATAMECDMCGGSRDVTTSVVIIDVDDSVEEAVLDIDAVEVKETNDTKRTRIDSDETITVDTEIAQCTNNVAPDPPTPVTTQYSTAALTDEYLDNRLKLNAVTVDAFEPSVVEVVGRRVGDLRAGKNMFIGVHDHVVNVETLVMQLFASGVNDEGGWHGWHCEGSILEMLFGLLCWDILFMEVAEVFQCPFQDAPLDLDTAGGLFYNNRRDAIDQKLNWIETENIEVIVAYIGHQYRTNFRTRCRCVHWSLQLPVLQATALALGSAGLEVICRMKCLEHRSFVSGAPDLLLIRGLGINGTFDWKNVLDSEMELPEISEEMIDDIIGLEEMPMDDELDNLTSRPRRDIFACDVPDLEIAALLAEEWRFECKLVEVKGPTDRLSDTQQRWLYALSMNGIDNCVCRVREGGIDGVPKGFHKTANADCEEEYDIL